MHSHSCSGRPPAFSGFSKAKKAVDEGIAKLRKKGGRSPTPRWKLHDLRRIVKTLMIQAGVRPDISERVLSHTIQGVESVYDCYEYLAEKRDALESLPSWLVASSIRTPM